MMNLIVGSPESKAWCSQMWRTLADGGVWGLPSYGLIFNKRGGKLVCTLRMPHDPQMPLTADELKEHQDGILRLTVEHFAAIGVTVEDQSK